MYMHIIYSHTLREVDRNKKILYIVLYCIALHTGQQVSAFIKNVNTTTLYTKYHRLYGKVTTVLCFAMIN